MSDDDERDVTDLVRIHFEQLRERQVATAEELQLDCLGLNPFVIKKQGLNQSDIDEIRFHHSRKDRLLKLMDELDEVKDRTELREYVDQLEQVEFAMQRAWKFEQDANYHTWWLKSRHCKCPGMDNRDMTYYGRGKIKMQACPLHGWDNE